MKKFIIAMILATTLGGAKAYLDHQLHQELDKVIVKNQIGAEYSKISSSLLGQVIIEDLRLQTYVQIDKVILSKAYEFYNELPESMYLELEGVEIFLNNTAESVPIRYTPMLIYALGYSPYYVSLKELNNLGYPNIRANIALNAKLHNKKLLVSAEIDANIWGKFNILAELNNVAKSIDDMELVSLQIQYFDDGLVNKTVSHLAERGKITQAQLQNNFITKLNNDIKQTSITNNIQQFIKNPQILTIDMKPDFPMNMNMLQNFPIQKIELKIIANELKPI